MAGSVSLARRPRSSLLVLGLGISALCCASALCCRGCDLLPLALFVSLPALQSRRHTLARSRTSPPCRTPLVARGAAQTPTNYFGGGTQALRYEKDYSARWDHTTRERTKSPEEAEKIIMMTGRMPRPLRLSDVKMGSLPLRKTIVATAKERRAAAEMTSTYAVTKLQAKLLLVRERHPIWGHERILVYGHVLAEYLLCDAISNDPIEVSVPSKFKAAFREDADPYMPTREAQWNKELERRGLKPEIAEGKAYESYLQNRGEKSLDIPENIFNEAILDNVVDLGELVLQFYGAHVDRQPTSKNVKQGKLNRRLNKRMKKAFPGLDFNIDLKTNLTAIEDKPKPEDLDEYSGAYTQFARKGQFRHSNGNVVSITGI
eukprot:TRINITY_DN92895_c0_g1_i1.p1 TRINITY_DN92895_c0_g1~~TRINITY_DN92895_c0_g1_i1.p1  ORF type:complete len:406 (-),score=66.97 TRINITY_DN92895_c0_g1_i1:70-1194(-)